MNKVQVQKLLEDTLARFTSSEAPVLGAPKGRQLLTLSKQSDQSLKSAVYRLEFRWTPIVQDLDLVKKFQPMLERYFSQRGSYIFQLEKGDVTGKLHFQCSLKVRTKVRPDTFRNQFSKSFEVGRSNTI